MIGGHGHAPMDSQFGDHMTLRWVVEPLFGDSGESSLRWLMSHIDSSCSG